MTRILEVARPAAGEHASEDGRHGPPEIIAVGTRRRSILLLTRGGQSETDRPGHPAGLARRAVDWKWGSARWYELRQSAGVPIGWVDVAE